jgi:hypothetical protein
MDLFLQWLGLVGQQIGGHTDSHQAFLLEEIELVGQGSDMGDVIP